MSKIIYRRAKDNEAPALMKVGYSSFSKYKSLLTSDNWTLLEGGLLSQEKQDLLMKKSACYVAETEGVIVGSAYMIPSGHKEGFFEAEWSQLRRVSVLPDHEGKGIGKTLTALCIQHAVASGENVMALHTSEIMDAARALYEGLGFMRLKEIEPLFGKRYWLYLLDLKKLDVINATYLKYIPAIIKSA